MNKPIVSVITPFIKYDKLLDEMICSLQLQTLQNWELVMVFDGFKNKLPSPSLYRNVDRIKLCCRDEKLGANGSRNYGLKISNGMYIQWFDSDDLMHPEFLELKVKSLNESNADFVVCKGAIFKGKIENKIGDWDKLSGTTPVLDQALGKINFQTNAPMFRRDFLEGKKLWNETLQRKQDYEFFNRILAQSANYKIVDECLFFYRQHAQSINGINSPTTIRSMIVADLLVYKNTIQTIGEEDDKFKLQQHFFRKIISRSKIALKNKYLFTYFKGLWGALSIIDFNYIINYFQRK
jgi:glycosyltransferase involved in cell wall biosynthesis